jgi:hypothetical protein
MVVVKSRGVMVPGKLAFDKNVKWPWQWADANEAPDVVQMLALSVKKKGKNIPPPPSFHACNSSNLLTSYSLFSVVLLLSSHTLMDNLLSLLIC